MRGADIRTPIRTKDKVQGVIILKNYSLKTLEKMLEMAKEKYYSETSKPCGNWGDGMRLSKLPQYKAWERARDRACELEKAIQKKKEEMKNA